MRTKSLLFSTIRIALGVLFLWASLYKIRTPADFAHEIFNYKLVPVGAINASAIILPWVQFLAGCSLIINVGARGSSVLVFLMMLMFQTAVASALFRGLNISCGCFRSGGSSATWLTFTRDTLILALAGLQLWLAFRKTPSKENHLWTSMI